MFNTRNSLHADTRGKVCSLLNAFLATLSDLNSQTKQAHWNVRGRQFYSLHKLFDELAATIEEHIDPLAERITALGGTAHGTVRQAAANSALAEFPIEQGDELSFVAALVERYGQSANIARKAIDDLAELGDADSSDLMTAISRDLDKSLWFLEAHSHA